MYLRQKWFKPKHHPSKAEAKVGQKVFSGIFLCKIHMTYFDPNIVTSYRHDQFLGEKNIVQVPKITNWNNFGILILTKS